MIDVVYATGSAYLQDDMGGGHTVAAGSHWPADDPLVRTHPGMFSADPRYGLNWSGAPPQFMSEPPVESTDRTPGRSRTVPR